MISLIDLHSARTIFIKEFPAWLDFLDYLDAKAGQLQFKPEFGNYLKVNNHDSYPLIYERLPKLMGGCRLALQRCTPANLILPGTEISFATPQDRGRFMVEFLSDLDELEPLIGPHFTDRERAAADSVVQGFEPEDMEAIGPLLKILPSIFMAMFYEYLSVAVHGVPLSTLVQRSIAGDDDAYGKALQIDGQILFVLPYFAERLTKARLEGDKGFLRMVANKMDSPGYRGRVKQKGIWLVIALLDLFGLLETMTGEELLDFCSEVGANEGDTPVEDVKNMLKRVATYKRYQKSDPLSTL